MKFTFTTKNESELDDFSRGYNIGLRHGGILTVIIIIAAFLIAPLVASCQKVNKKPSLFSITTLENIPRMIIVDSYYKYIIYSGKNVLKIDADGVFTSGNDTLANSCELLDWFEYSFKAVSMKTTTQDSAYIYRREALFYRQWFKDNSTPNPLKQKNEFKNN